MARKCEKGKGKKPRNLKLVLKERTLERRNKRPERTNTELYEKWVVQITRLLTTLSGDGQGGSVNADQKISTFKPPLKRLPIEQQHRWVFNLSGGRSPREYGARVVQGLGWCIDRQYISPGGGVWGSCACNKKKPWTKCGGPKPFQKKKMVKKTGVPQGERGAERWGERTGLQKKKLGIYRGEWERERFGGKEGPNCLKKENRNGKKKAAIKKTHPGKDMRKDGKRTLNKNP